MIEKPALDWLQRADCYLFRAIAVIVPGLAAVAPRATAAALFIAGAYQILRVFFQRPIPMPNMAIGGGFLALVLWAYLSTNWSLVSVIRPATGLLILLGIGLLVTAWAKNREFDKQFLNYLCIGFGVAVVVYLFELISWGWLTRALHGFSWTDIIDDVAGGTPVFSYLINGTTILSILVWPAVTGLMERGQRMRAFALFLTVLALAVYFGRHTGLIALSLGAIAWCLVSWGGAKAVRATALLFFVFIFVTPFAVTRTLTPAFIDRVVVEAPHTPSSVLVRLMIWKFTAERIFERPILGWGFDAARRIPGGGEKFTIRNAEGRELTTELNLPLHPHNQVLQLWLELGAVGALIVAFTGAYMIAKIAKLPTLARKGSIALATTAIVFDGLSFGAWQTWWIAAVFLAFAVQLSINLLLEPRTQN